ncbi:YheC/YheD family endospore coat-associated protein [Gottfriedia luciferensis]|uniref:YheC/YheD family endospore coat-associated protein n=1 Tax=Gottfriedia luciferensis TaxID=178774 RepID=UPI000B43F623|nr:YheC/YheD family protein [Gottfriedia luciferensis]
MQSFPKTQDTQTFAIVTDSINETSLNPLGSITTLCEELSELCGESEINFYVTSLKKLLTNEMKGYKRSDNGWILVNVPPPSIIHNRIHSRKLERSKEFKLLNSSLETNQIPFFNARFLNKLEVFKALIDSNYIKPYVPYTEECISVEQLENFLQKYDSVFIKPIHGSQGRNIFKVTKDKQQFRLLNSLNSEVELEYQSVAQLFQPIKQQLTKRSFIIQEGLPLITKDNRLVDFRFLCHKNKFNKWEVTSTVARIGHPTQFVSNLARGGDIQKIDEFLSYYLPKKERIHFKKLLIELAIESCICIDSSFDGLFAEFGVDLAIDDQFNPWVIEINSKPSKDLQVLDPLQKIRPSTKAIFSLVQSYL